MKRWMAGAALALAACGGDGATEPRSGVAGTWVSSGIDFPFTALLVDGAAGQVTGTMTFATATVPVTATATSGRYDGERLVIAFANPATGDRTTLDCGTAVDKARRYCVGSYSLNSGSFKPMLMTRQ
jgi:hypothetical protein